MNTLRVVAVVLVLATVAGFSFASVSTSDFIAHLDRNVHGLHCLPSLAGETGDEACRTAMMSPYSSVLRRSVWGGVPISLPGMAVFAFLFVATLATWMLGRLADRRAAAGLVIASAVPLCTSIVMGVIATRELGAICTNCAGIYASSLVAFLSAIVLFARSSSVARTLPEERLGPPPKIVAKGKRAAQPAADESSDDAALLAEAAAETRLKASRTLQGVGPDTTLRDPVPAPSEVDTAAATLAAGADNPLELDESAMRPQRRLATESQMEGRVQVRAGGANRRVHEEEPAAAEQGPLPWSAVGLAVLAGLGFVLVPTAVYAAMAPDFDRFVGACGELPEETRQSEVLIHIGPEGDVPAIEVLDPLCPSCRALESQLSTLEDRGRLDLRVALFPLDPECNWMMTDALHPGACAISEAMICGADQGRADEVLEWAFDNQDAILSASRRDAAAAGRMARERFPALASCIGSTGARARLNRALRYAIDAHLPIVTPQLYVDGVQLCPADTDLGLDYTLATLLERRGEGGAR